MGGSGSSDESTARGGGDEPAASKRTLKARRRRTLWEDAKNLPNLLTFARIVMIPAVLLLLARGAPRDCFWAAAVYALAAITDMLGGQIPIGFGVASSAEPFIKAQQLKALAVTSARRSPLYPDWPAIAETLPGFEAVNWAGFAGPAALPDELTRRIADDILAVAAGQRMREGLREMGIEYAPQGPAEFKAFIASEIERFGKVTQPIPTGGKS